jgi:uncharacterized LabA/DUF88 family protein
LGKNVAVFVDVANIFYAAKAAGVDIDYVTLLKAAIAGRDFVRAYAYTGLDPENENQRNFHSFLSRHGYKVVSKDIRKYGDGKVKANLDIELVVDLMKTSRNLDVAIIVSGDGDFAPAIRAVQEMGVRCEVISFRGNTSSDLIEVADQFSDITHLARVERSGRSGRRVADDEFDLSMTEVPDKQTEGSGAGRASRGSGTRGRGRGRPAERVRDAEVVAISGDRGSRGDRNGSGGGSMTVLPGEKLSGRGAPRAGEAEADVDADAVASATDEIEVFEEGAATTEAATAEGADGRRRRRRGGRGRGRGRGRGEDGAMIEGEPVQSGERPRLPYEDEEPVPGPRGQRPTPFGSIWDSQLGVPASPPPAAAEFTALPDEEDEDEPEIPEYLLAERRRGRGSQGGQRGGQMGGRRAAYAAALDRERFGRGAGSSGRFQEPQGRPPMPAGPGGGGQRQRQDQPPRGGRPDDRRDRDRYQGGRDRAPVGAAAPRPERRGPGSDEPWSEVPPEIEELLRAQIATRKPAGGPPAVPADVEPVRADAHQATEAPAQGRGRGRGRRPAGETSPAAESAAMADVAAASDAPAAAPATRSRRRSAATAADGPPEAAASPAPAEAPAAPPSTRGRRRSTTAAAASDAGAADVAAPAAAAPAAEAPAGASAPAPKRGRRTSTAAASDAAAEAAGSPDVEAPAATPARKTRTRAAATSDAAAEAGATGEAEAPKSTTRRRMTKKADTSA